MQENSFIGLGVSQTNFGKKDSDDDKYNLAVHQSINVVNKQFQSILAIEEPSQLKLWFGTVI